MHPSAVLSMQATRILRSNAHPDPKNGVYLGGWGDLGSQKQKNITTYALSANRQKPLAGTMHAAVFNVFRRTRHQILYWLPPLLIGYATMQWATERKLWAAILDDGLMESEHGIEAVKNFARNHANPDDAGTNTSTRSLEENQKLQQRWTV